jgi:hypothetical protein
MPSRQSRRSAGVELDFSQGSDKKIRLQRLVRQRPFQPTDLLAERRLTGIRRRPFARFGRFELIAPRIEQPPIDTERLRQLHDVVVLLQPRDRVLPKRLLKFARALLGHACLLPGASVPMLAVSI